MGEARCEATACELRTASRSQPDLQKLPCIRLSARGDVLRRARHHHFAAGVATFRAEVDHVVGGLDHVEVVLDQQDGVAGVHQPVQTCQQALHVRQVQPRRRLVEDVDGVLRHAEACSAPSRS